MLRVGILGSGRVAVRHAEAWQAAGATITAVCGHHEGDAEKWMKKHGIAAKSFYSLRNPDTDWIEEVIGEFLREDFEALSITTPPHDHVEHLRESMGAGKHVIVEKPLYCSTRDLWGHMPNRHGWQKNPDSYQVTGVCFVNRWFPAIQNARQLVQDLGTIVSVRATYINALTHEKPVSRRDQTRRGSMSTLLSSGCHVIDLVQWLIKSPIVEVWSVSPLESATNQASIRMPLRTSELSVRFDNGAVGSVSVSDECFHPFAFRLMVLGENGSIEITESYARIYAKDRSNIWEDIPGDIPSSGAIAQLPYEAMFAHFADCIRRGQPTECDISDRYVLTTHQVCLAAEESAQGRDGSFVFRHF